MANLLFRGKGLLRYDKDQVDLPMPPTARHKDPAQYVADDGLVDAVNVALYLRQPLLLTGKPGTGKTQLAYRVAWELGFEPPLKFETKSTSTARDLFYTYDSLGRFYSAQSGDGPRAPLSYISFNALGLAILHANAPNKVAHLMPDSEAHLAIRRSVVLIDEIDKAPRDFPNDVLNEVEEMYFKIPEMGNVTVTAEQRHRPILIMTSNSEQNLPNAFLRRCVFYDIPFPGRQRLKRIVHSRLGKLVTENPNLLEESLDLFEMLNDPSAGLLKPPSTSEFLAWLRVLIDRTNDSDRGPGQDQEGQWLMSVALSVLIKTGADQQRAQKIIGEWNRSKVSKTP